MILEFYEAQLAYDAAAVSLSACQADQSPCTSIWLLKYDITIELTISLQLLVLHKCALLVGIWPVK